MKKLTAILCVIAIVLSSQLALGNVVYSNPYSSDSEDAFSSWYDMQAGELVHQSFTDFYWDGSYSITDFHFWGCNWSQQNTMEGFQFQIYSNDGNDMPGSLVYDEYIAGNGGAALEEYNSNFGYDIYKYGFDLGTAFNPVDAGYYWISVYAYDPDYSNWFWAQGDGIMGYADWQHQSINDPTYEGWVHPYTGDDFAFEITSGCVVPEPTTLTLLGLGLIGFAIRRRKK